MRHVAIILFALFASPAWGQNEIRPGVAVDARGQPMVDPTENVKALVLLEAKRQDGLREASDKFNAAQIAAIKELADAEAKHLKEIVALRADMDEKLKALEAKRLDAIRLVDVNAVSEDRRRTGEQAVALATQVAQSAETLRSLVSTTKTSTDLSTNQITQALSQRITTLEQAGYQQTGRQTFQDPALAASISKLEATVTALAQARATTTGASEGQGALIGWIFGGIGLLLGIGGFVLAFTRKK